MGSLASGIDDDASFYHYVPDRNVIDSRGGLVTMLVAAVGAPALTISIIASVIVAAIALREFGGER